MRILKNIWKNETVCCIAFFLAVFSAFLVTPDGEYLAYPILPTRITGPLPYYSA